MLKEKINEGFSYFKKIFWIFLLVLIVLNVIFYYFVSGYYYIIGLIIGNIFLIWILIPVFIWVAKTYLITESIEIYDDVKEEIIEKVESNIKK